MGLFNLAFCIWKVIVRSFVNTIRYLGLGTLLIILYREKGVDLLVNQSLRLLYAYLDEIGEEYDDFLVLIFCQNLQVRMALP